MIALRQELTAAGLDAGPHTLHAHLQDAGLRVPSVATIWRILTRDGLVTPEPRKRPKRSYLRFQADLPNECWQSDFTHWPLADGTDTEILTWLDDHARYAISLTAHAPVTGEDVVTTLPRRGRRPRHPRLHPHRQRNGVHHPIPARPQRLRTGTGHPGHRAEERSPEPPPNPGQGRALPADPEEVARAQPPADRSPNCSARRFRDTTTTNGHTDPWPTHPREVYTARAKATPTGSDGHWRIRHDRSHHPAASPCDTADALHHIGLGYEHNTTTVRILVHDLHITVINADTGEIIRDLDPRPHPRLPTPRPPTRTTQRQPPTRRTQEEEHPTDTNEVARHLLTMSRDFTRGVSDGT